MCSECGVGRVGGWCGRREGRGNRRVENMVLDILVCTVMNCLPPPFRDDGCSLTLDASQKPVTKDQPVQGVKVYLEEGSVTPRPLLPCFASWLAVANAKGRSDRAIR